MADFYTTKEEEALIELVIRNGFETELPKYNVLNVAFGVALGLESWALNSPLWSDKMLGGSRGGEYHLKQIAGDDETDLLYRALIYAKHKNELERDGKNIFEDDKNYLEILAKYIHRGLYEIQRSWKSKDCFYAWMAEKFAGGFEMKNADVCGESGEDSDKIYEQIREYFSKFGVKFDKLGKTSSYRKIFYRIALKDSTMISKFKNRQKELDNAIGTKADVRELVGVANGFGIGIPKPQSEWESVTRDEFDAVLASHLCNSLTLGVVAGFDNTKKPLLLDLKDEVHMIVAGTTGSGKSVFLRSVVTALVAKAEVSVVDATKNGEDFAEFAGKVNLVLGVERALAFLDEVEAEVKRRFENGVKAPLKVVVVDEMKDLFDQDKSTVARLATLAQKSRAAGVHLVLATQRFDGNTFAALKANVPCKVALKMATERDSLLLGIEGGEKLTGKGHMLVLRNGTSEPVEAYGVNL